MGLKNLFRNGKYYAQIYETLKDGGYLLIRGVDKYDCQELKKAFGKETIYDKKPISIIDYENVLDAGLMMWN